MNEADKLFEFCAIEMRNNLELQNSVHLLYSPDIEKCVKKLLSIYESFQLGHVYFTNAEFDSAIQKIIQVSKHRLTRAHREKQLKMSCQALHNAPPNRT